MRISVSIAGYTTSRGRVRVLATHSIHQFPLHFPSCASPRATTFRTQHSNNTVLKSSHNRLLNITKLSFFLPFQNHEILLCYKCNAVTQSEVNETHNHQNPTHTTHLLTEQWQILIRKSGLSEGYTIRHCLPFG